MRAGRLAMVVAVGLFLLPATAHADTLTVTKTADTNDLTCDADCSLREAVGDSAAGDTVIVPASGSDYALTMGEILIPHPLTIDGASAATSAVNASGTSRVFHLTAGVTATGTVTFSDLTIENGNTTTYPGGAGIKVDSGSDLLSLVNAVVTGNTATLTAGVNSEAGGGGIHSLATPGVTLTNSSVTGNDASVDTTDGCCHGGAGIFTSGGPLTITDSHVDGNDLVLTGLGADGGLGCCGGGGGLMQDANANTTLTRSTVDGNTVTASLADCCWGGGGIFVAFINPAFTTTLVDTTVNSNTATVNGPAPTTMADNHCCSGGGGIFAGTGLNMTGGEVDDNTATVNAGDCCHGGAGIKAEVTKKAVSLTGVSLTNNTLGGTTSGGSGGGGGFAAFHNEAGELPIATRFQMTDSLVSGNQSNFTGGTSDGGGGLNLQIPDAARITNSTISGNSTTTPGATQGGGGIYAGGEPLTLANVTIAGNSAPSGAGGGVFTPEADVQSRNSLMGLNTASTGADCLAVGTGSFTTLGYNLEGAPGSCGFAGTGDQVVAEASLGLAGLAANGGPTLTRALLTGSPAINAGNPAGCLTAAGGALSTDQRGLTRPSGGRCDIGAFEVQEAAAPGPQTPTTPPVTACKKKKKKKKKKKRSASSAKKKKKKKKKKCR